MNKYNYSSLMIRTTGEDIKLGQVLEIGMVLDNLAIKVIKDDLDNYIEDLPYFHCVIKHDVIKGDPLYIEKNNRLINIIANEPITTIENINPEDIKTYIVTSHDSVYKEVFNFLKYYGMIYSKENPKGNSVVLAGLDIGSYILPYINTIYGFKAHGIYNFNSRNIDISNLYINPYYPLTNGIVSSIDIDFGENALEDARIIIKLIKLSNLYN